MKKIDEFVINTGDLLILDKDNLIGNANPESIIVVEVKKNENSDKLMCMITGQETFLQIYCHHYKLIKQNDNIKKMAMDCINAMFDDEVDKHYA